MTNKLTQFLVDEWQAHRKGGLYHKTQVQLAYRGKQTYRRPDTLYL